MDYFLSKAQESEVTLPNWVSKDNASYRAYKAVEELVFERLSYIECHNRKSHYKLRRSYQISGSEVAQKIGITKTTLLVSSSYSQGFKQHLSNVNQRLLAAKEKRLAETHNSYSRGPTARPKESLVREVRECQKRIDELERMNAIQQVQEAFNRLHLDVKALLQIEETDYAKSSVLNLKPRG